MEVHLARVSNGNSMSDYAATLGEPGNVVVDGERDLELLQAWAVAGQAAGIKVWVQVNPFDDRSWARCSAPAGVA